MESITIKDSWKSGAIILPDDTFRGLSIQTLQQIIQFYYLCRFLDASGVVVTFNTVYKKCVDLEFNISKRTVRYYFNCYKRLLECNSLSLVDFSEKKE